MANALYDSGRNAFLKGEIDWENDTIMVALIDTDDYTFSASHEFLDDVGGSAIVATAALSGMTAVAGVADANNVTFTSVSGDQSEAVIIYKDTSDPETSPLIAYIDTAASGLPVSPNGGDITVQWSDGSNKIFKL